MESNHYNAVWWSKDNDTAWDHAKAAFRRDWEQTKHDFGGNPGDLNQDVPDTVKQAAGKQVIPPLSQPNFEEHEPAFRFGYGARRHYGSDFPAWDDRLEQTLQNEWNSSGDAEAWKRYSQDIRRGYEYSPKH